MAFTTGTASNHNDLLDKLRLYLIAQGWTILSWTAGALVTDQAILKVRGPGAGAGKEVFINIRTHNDPVLGSYSWEVRGAVGYSAPAAWGSQLSESPSWYYFNTWQNSITYWFYVNDRRFIVVAKCSTNYMSMHAGFFLPWGTPTDYPFPLLIATDFYQQQPWSFNNSARRMFVDPGMASSSHTDQTTTAAVRTPAGIWQPLGNHNVSSQTNLPIGVSKGNKGFIWPYGTGSNAGGVSQPHYPIVWSGGQSSLDPAYAFESLVPTQQNERPLLPCMIVPGDQPCLGVIDGVYCVGGTGLVTEQAITLGGRTFRAFQNISRNSPDDFFCVEEI